MPRLWGRKRHAPESVGLIDVARALLTEDKAEAERIAASLAHQRERGDQLRAEREDQQAQRERADASAKWIQRECRRQGFWWPSDYR